VLSKAYIEDYYKTRLLELQTAATLEDKHRALDALYSISITAAELYGVAYAESLRDRYYKQD
jgi:hypothetical protein